jgi:large subunit ribosomal protein L17
MRHRVAHRKLGRVTEHRLAMLRNQATALLRHEHITTTVPRAKELRPFVERLITIAKRGLAGGEDNGKALHARRLVMQDLQDREVVGKLFDTVAPRFEGRPGGYTRLLRIGFRKGDAAEVAQVELVGSEFNPRAKAEADAKQTEATPKAKGVGGRLRAAAERLRGKKSEGAAEHESAAATEATAAKRAAKKGTAGRKMGGSSKGK